MQKTTSLRKKLENSPALASVTFAPDKDFRWDHTTQTIYYSDDTPYADQYLLHEVSHGLLRHIHYSRDTDLIAMERDAWQKARELAATYNIRIDDEVVEDALDSYRDWLHARSTCPACDSTGVQTSEKAYSCLACHTTWIVNEARSCALRRYAK